MSWTNRAQNAFSTDSVHESCQGDRRPRRVSGEIAEALEEVGG
jgi:hypothetical protein